MFSFWTQNNVLVFVVLISYDTVFLIYKDIFKALYVYMYIQSGYFSKSFQNVRECRNMKSVFAAVAITDKQ